MTALPDDAIGYRIAAIRPCGGDPKWCTPLLYEPFRCPDCRGDGTRILITDVAVERGEPVFAVGIHEYRKPGTYWREVKS